jgi:transposase
VSRQQKPSRQVSVDEQIQVVLAVLKGELSLAEAARRHGVSSATVGDWRTRYLTGRS